MDINAYEYLLNGLRKHNASLTENFGNEILEYQSTDTTYPNTVFQEVRNLTNPSFNSDFDRVASVGYSVEIYAKTKGNIDKKTIARNLAKSIDDYLRRFRLSRISFNCFDLENEASIFLIVMTYSGNLHENKLRFI